MPVALRPLSHAILAALALAACGGKSAGNPEKPGAGNGGSGSAPVVAAASAPLTEIECMQLLDHYLELALAEKRATLPPEQVPTDEQVARIRAALRDEAKETCAGQTERGRYECAMRARSTRALGTCLTAGAAGGG